MAVLKCKMCGGDLNVTEGMKVAECEFCGTQQTVPSGDDDKKTNLFNRANHLRLANEFDRAAAIFESIVNEFPNEAEAYWGLVLCKYGIEYVDDPVTGRKIPTCHRTSYDSIFNDVNYRQALDNADSVAQDVYKREADTINNIQKGILDIVKNEEPFDVFICYKESDDSGARTQDSVLAQDLYYQLTKEGFKVFFARITLEGKLGTAYEPYIFAALNSAKVMVVVGTKPEYYNAVWVKNEWSRFLDMMKKDSSKILIPAYKNMDPYDLPDALSMFQAQDMSKLGFMQDLIRGISKLAGKQEAAAAAVPVQQVVAAAPISSNIENLLKRGNLALEDKKWNEADGFFEQVLNENVEEPRAYLGKLMAELHFAKERMFEVNVNYISESDSYKKAYRFADDELKKKLNEYISAPFYNNGALMLKKADSEDILNGCMDDYREAARLFGCVPNYKDAEGKKAECERKIEETLEIAYNTANDILKKAEIEAHCGNAKRIFDFIAGYKDSEKKSQECEIIAKKLNDYEQGCLRLKKANSYLDFIGAKSYFDSLGDFRNSKEYAKECMDKADKMRIEENEKIYSEACASSENEDEDSRIYSLESAVKKFEMIKGYKDADFRGERCRAEIEELKKKQAIKKIIISVSAVAALVLIINIPNIKLFNQYRSAVKLMESGNYTEAYDKFVELGHYKDSADKIYEIDYNNAVKLMESGNYTEAYDKFVELGHYNNSTDKLAEIEDKCQTNIIEQISVADIRDMVMFGTWEDEPIRWYVISKDEEKALLLSEENITSRSYNAHNDKKLSEWAICGLRSWLNDPAQVGSFISSAFTEEGRAHIMPANLTNPGNPEYGTSGGISTFDNVFILSAEEVKTYGCGDLFTDGYYWLRTPGQSEKYAAVIFDNQIDYAGQLVLSTQCVRPALYIKLTD